MLYDYREVNEMIINENLMGLINAFLVILTLLLVYMGYRKGFLSKLLSVFSFLVVVFISWNIAPYLADIFQIMPTQWTLYQGSILQEFFYNYMNQLCIFVLLVILISLVLFILKPIVLLVTKLPVISWVNALFGSLLGLVESFLLMGALVFILQTPLVKNGQQVIDGTLLSSIAHIQENLLLLGNDLILDFQAMEQDDSIDVNQLKDFLEKKGIDEYTIQQFLLELGQ